ncbi:MAG: hypothetical protein C5B50_16850 [Verrucomicrobia bacterium]|nr:MAG: hypothetical protein C5B50_16850 [Verrucomicrobiota bacterium]
MITADVRRRRAGDRGQRSEDRGQRAEVRGRGTEVRGQRAGDGAGCGAGRRFLRCRRAGCLVGRSFIWVLLRL